MGYVCIECGQSINELYKRYTADILKLNVCEGCSSVVDKYIEYDATLVILDSLLLKPQAFRHILFNADLKDPFRFILFVFICDSLYLWKALEPSLRTTGVSANLEFFICVLFVICLVKNLVYHLVSLAAYFVVKLTVGLKSRDDVPLTKLLSSLILASAVKLVCCPVVLWCTEPLYLNLTSSLVLVFSVQTLQLLLGCPKVAAFFVVASGIVGEKLTEHYLPERIIDGLGADYLGLNNQVQCAKPLPFDWVHNDTC